MCAPLAWHKQRFDVVFCVWRALRWPGPGHRHDLVALIAGYSYLITGFVGPGRGSGPLHARAKMRVHNIRTAGPEHVYRYGESGRKVHPQKQRDGSFATRGFADRRLARAARGPGSLNFDRHRDFDSRYRDISCAYMPRRTAPWLSTLDPRPQTPGQLDAIGFNSFSPGAR